MAASPPRTILVLGAGGALGRAIVDACAEHSQIRCVGLVRSEADVTERRQVDNAIRKYEADVVINCAAMTDVDGCERNPLLAAAVNAEGAANVARACRAAGADLVHFSTDFVFDGTAGRPYTEADEPSPLNVYGATKLEGERKIRLEWSRALIVRTAWTFGPGRENFVTKVLARARRDGRLAVVTTQTGSPTFTRDLARGVLALATNRVHGLYHIVNEGIATRFEFAEEIVRLAEVDATVEPLDAAPPAADGGATAVRPAYSALDPSAFAAKARCRLPNWRDALAAYVKELASG